MFIIPAEVRLRKHLESIWQEMSLTVFVSKIVHFRGGSFEPPFEHP